MNSQSKIKTMSDFLIANRIRLSSIIIILLIVEDIMAKVIPYKINGFNNLLGISGALLALVGIFLRSWAAGIVRKGKDLATTGPYSLTRHPLYVGSLLLAVGACVIIGNMEDTLVVLALAIIFYLPKIKGEELCLSERFGEKWKEYAKNTAMLFPKKFPPKMDSTWSFTQWSRNKEYYTFTGSLVVLTILELAHEYWV